MKLKYIMKKGLACMVAAAVMTMAVPISFDGAAGVTVQAGTVSDTRTVRKVNINVNGSIAGIKSPTVPASVNSTDAWDGTKVYYGSYNGNSHLFRVLQPETTEYSADQKTKTMFLDSDTAVNVMAFRADVYATDAQDWNTSDIRSWMNGTSQGQFLCEFTTAERDAISASTKSVPHGTGNSAWTKYWMPLTGDKVFALDVDEVVTPKYGYRNFVQASKAGPEGSRYYWTRYGEMIEETGKAVIRLICIGEYADLSGLQMLNPEVTKNNPATSPAMNLDLSKVLFTMDANVNSETKIENQPIQTSSADVWKMTLLDETKSATLSQGQSAYSKKTGDVETVYIPYTYTGSDVTQLSVMVTSKKIDHPEVEVYYYGKLTTDTEFSATGGSGTGYFTLPESLKGRTLGWDYHMYLFAETVRGGNYTNTASVPTAVSEVIKRVSLDITNPADSHLVLRTEPGDGAENQKLMQGINEEMDAVIYTVEDGYYIPEDYADQFGASLLNGMTITRVSHKQLKLSGKLIADTAVTLAPIAKIETLPMPNITIDYKNATLIGFVSGASYDISGTVFHNAALTRAIGSDEFGKTFSIRRVCTEKEAQSHTDSSVQTLLIPKRPGKPAVTAVNETKEYVNDGKLVGVNASLEYKLTTEKAWKSVPANVTILTGLVPGTYEVRVKATNTTFPGEVLQICVKDAAADMAEKTQEIAKEYGVSEDTLNITDETIAAQKDDKDIKGSSFGKLKAKVTKNNKTSVTLKWSKVKGADGYIIYGNRCNTKSKKYKCEPVKTLSANKTSYTAKKLKKGQYYKFIVRAYKNVNGKKVTIASSVTLHTITKGGKYGVAKSVKIEKVGSKKNATKITLKKGKTATIKAKEIKESKPIKRHRKLVYESSNTKVATVSKSGKIKARGKGKCKIYVYAQNGVYKTISVTVK